MKMFEMMKQVQQMRKIQKTLAAKTVEIASNDKLVTVVARGDMSIERVTINQELLGQTKHDRLERTLASTINSALDSAKKAAASDMAKLTGGMGGLSDLLGGG